MRPLIIGIGGAHSSAGKTAYASLLLQRLKGWGAIKYTKTALYCSIVDDPYLLAKEDKDTRRLLDSGAERVLWVQSPPDEIKDILPMAVERLSDLKGIIVEGNSAIEFLKPDIIIFVFGNDIERIKESAKKILSVANAVVYKGSNDLIVTGNKLKGSNKLRVTGNEIEKSIGENSSLSYEQFVSHIVDMVDNKEKIRSLLKDKAIGGKLPCPVARRIAEELSVPYKEIGEAADELDIKIADCELGCF
jgi:molybdopterin-guanine dinucleotide biosynthesis protein